MTLSRDAILKANDIKTIDIDVPEWGGSVRVATISGAARDRFETSMVNKNGSLNSVNLRAKLVAACVVDDKGNLLFKESDIDELGKKSCIALNRVFQAAQKINGMGNSEIEDSAKN